MTSARPRSEPRWVFLAGALVLALATLLRTGWPTLAEFKFDEARMATLAMELPHQGHLPLAGLPSSAGFEHSPISVYLYMPAFVFGTSVVPAIIYGGLLNVAALALCWRLARRWPGPRTAGWEGLIPVLLLATSPWAIAFGRKLWQITFVIPLTLLFVCLAVAALVPGPASTTSKAQGRRLTGAIVALALLIQVHPSAILLVPAFGLWLLSFRRRVELMPILLGIGLGLVTAAPFLLHQVRTGWPVLDAARSWREPTWNAAALRLAWEAVTGRGFHVLSGTVLPWLGVLNLIGWATVASVLRLGWRVARDWRSADPGWSQAAQVDLILLSWLGTPILLSLRHSLDLQLHSFALIIPAAFLIIGRALGTHQTGGEPSNRLSPLAVGSFSTGLVCLAAIQVLLMVLTGRAVAGDRASEAFGTPLRRYLEIAEEATNKATTVGAAEILVVGKGDSTVVDEIPAILDVLLSGRLAHRFVDGQSAAVFPAGSAAVLLTPGAREGADWYRSWPTQPLGDGYELVALDGSWPEEGISPIPGLRLFQNGIEVQGYAWQVEPGTSTARRLWLLWQVLWLSPDDTHFSVRLVDRDGKSIGQADRAGYPTAYRRKGDRILSKFDFPSQERSASAGPFWAAAYVYLYPQVIDLPVIDQAGNAVAESIAFGPLSEEP